MKSSPESKIFYTNQTLNIRGRLVNLSTPAIMGILNVTPDSFYDGGKYNSDLTIATQAEKMIEEGATFLDIGGYSSRPGAEEVSVDEEIGRVLKAIKIIVKKFPDVILSIDTFRSQVAYAAIQEGAAMVNDISGGEQDEAMLGMVAKVQVPYVLMHMRGNPKTMRQFATYENLLKDITDYFHQKIHRLKELGVKDIIVDPGFGFAKTAQQNFELLNVLEYFKILNKPLLVGLSRKSMVWKTLTTTADQALNGTTCLHTIALLKGANILRVHDVKETAETIKLTLATTRSL